MADLDVGMAVGLIKALGSPDPAVIEGAVTDWLDDHPEATTTVQDGSITKAKLDANLQGTVDDVAGLKSDSQNLATRLSDYDGIMNLDSYFEIGNITMSTSGWTYNDNTLRVRTKQDTAIALNVGDVIKITDEVRVYVGWRINGNYYIGGWQTSDYVCPATAEYALLFEHVPATQITDISDLLQYVTFISSSNGEKTINALVDKVADASNLLAGLSYKNGYYIGNGTFTPTSPTGTNREITYDGIEAVPGAIYYLYTKTVHNSSWHAIVAFDENGEFISRVTSTSEYAHGEYYYGYTVYKCPYNAKTLSVSFRSYAIDYRAILLLPDMQYNASISNLSNIKAIAHRGAEYGAPENTSFAFTLAKIFGYLYVEGDVSFTSDLVPVLLHDTTINRTARNADGSQISQTLTLANITFQEANQYDYGIYKGEQFARVGIPTFDDWIIQCKKIGLKPYIEIKTNMVITQAMVDGLVATVKRYGMSDNCTWISTSTEVLDKVATALPVARLGALSDITNDTISWAVAKRTTGYDAFIDTDSSNITSEKCLMCVNADVPLEAWTLYTADAINALDPYVSGITSDALIATVSNLEIYKVIDGLVDF